MGLQYLSTYNYIWSILFVCLSWVVFIDKIFTEIAFCSNDWSVNGYKIHDDGDVSSLFCFKNELVPRIARVSLNKNSIGANLKLFSHLKITTRLTKN